MTIITIRIGNREVGEGAPCFIIAEAGVNHNGDVRVAERLIDAAAGAGADAVKFQTFSADTLVLPGAEKAGYQKETTAAGETQHGMLSRLELSEADFARLSAHAARKRLVFLSSPFDRASVDLLDRIDVPAYKIASGEITSLPLLAHVASRGKPVILSTGMATLGEIEEAVHTLRAGGAGEIVLLQCVTSYPAPPSDANLRVMEALRQAFQVPVGFSDHTLGIGVPIAAAALGACIVEKHLTLDRNLPGPDHRASLEPDEFAAMVRGIRDAEAALGDGIKRPTASEETIKRVIRKSIVAAVDIPKGTLLRPDMVTIKRPGTGIAPNLLDFVLKCRTKRDIKKDAVVQWEDLTGS
jgi:N-acetylneuraminate synthase/N,N'-diacetyllegionaminate synthase